MGQLLLWGMVILFYLGLSQTLIKINTLDKQASYMAFFYGCLCIIPLLFLKSMGITHLFISNTINALVCYAYAEEWTKRSFTLSCHIYKKMYIFAGGLVGTGFACAENLLYFSQIYTVSSSSFILFIFSRLIIATLGHFLFSSLSFHYIVIRKYIKSYLIPGGIHFLYNLIVVSNSFPFIIPLFFINYKVIAWPNNKRQRHLLLQ